MRPMLSIASRMCLAIALPIFSLALLLPRHACAWGGNAHKLVASQAMDTLPVDLRAYFENNRSFLLQHVSDPLEAEAKNPSLRHNHFIRLEGFFASASREIGRA